MPVLGVARWRSANGLAECLCIQELWKLGTQSYSARRFVTAGLQLAAAIMTRIRVI
jgi:hypothetical protein